MPACHLRLLTCNIVTAHQMRWAEGVSLVLPLPRNWLASSWVRKLAKGTKRTHKASSWWLGCEAE